MDKETKRFLIILCSQGTQNKYNLGEKKLRLQFLVEIKKALMLKSLNYDIATIDGKRPLINLEKDSVYKEWARDEQEKLLNPLNLNEIETKKYSGLILPSLSGFYDDFFGNFPSEYESLKDAIYSLQSPLKRIMSELVSNSKTVIVFGYGILPLFFAINENSEWCLRNEAIPSISLEKELKESFFPLIPLTVEEGICSLEGSILKGKEGVMLKTGKFILCNSHESLIEALALSVFLVNQCENNVN